MESPQMMGTGRVTVGRVVLITNRLLWGAMIAGQIAAGVVFGVILSQGDAPRAPRAIELPGIAVDAALLLVALVVTVIVRRRGVRGMEGDVAIRRRYTRNTLMPMALLEGAGLLGLCLVLVTGRWYPTAIVPGVALAAQLLIYPKATVRA